MKPIQPTVEGDVNWSESPLAPEGLSSDWIEITSPKNKSGDHRNFENKKTGEKIHFDQGNPEAEGNSKLDHWHRLNPEWTKQMKNKKNILIGMEILLTKMTLKVILLLVRNIYLHWNLV